MVKPDTVNNDKQYWIIYLAWLVFMLIPALIAYISISGKSAESSGWLIVAGWNLLFWMLCGYLSWLMYAPYSLVFSETGIVLKGVLRPWDGINTVELDPRSGAIRLLSHGSSPIRIAPFLYRDEEKLVHMLRDYTPASAKWTTKN